MGLGLGADVMMTKSMKIQTHSAITKAQEFAKSNNKVLQEKWDSILKKEGFNPLQDDIVSELARGFMVDEAKLMLFCETFNINFDLAKEELELLEKKRNEKTQQMENARNNKNSNKDNKNATPKIDLLNDIIPRTYSPEDIILMLEDKDKEKETKPYTNKFLKKDNLDKPVAHKWVIENVIRTKIYEDAYTFNITGEELAEKWLYNEIYYNSLAQRGQKNNKAICDQKEVSDISNLILNGTMDMKQLTLCLEKKEGSVLEYDEDTQTLTCEGEIFLIDGQHRTKADFSSYIINLQSNRSRVDLSRWYISMELLYLTLEQAGKKFGTINSGKAVSKSIREYHLHDDYQTLITKLDRDSKLNKKIIYTASQPTTKELVSFSVLRDALSINAKELSEFNMDEEFEYLRFCFNYLSHMLPDYFGDNEKNRVEKKKTSILNQNYMFYGLVALFYKKKDKEQVKVNIEKLKTLEEKGVFETGYIDEKTGKMLWLPCLKPAGGTKKAKGDWVINTVTSTRAEFSKILLGLLDLNE